MRVLGIDERRLHLKWLSASEGALFAEEIKTFVELLREMGDGPLIDAPASKVDIASQATA